MQPERRDLRFHLPAVRINDWHPEGPYVSHFLNTLSVFFPEGERFFIQSVRHFRDRVTDRDLAEAVTAFIGQEAMHGREHDEYNRRLAEAGYPVEEMEQRIVRLLERVKRSTPKQAQLAATIALEHFTAMLANQVLEQQRLLDDAEPHYARLWKWHAFEETEHKSVAYDVWNLATGESPADYAVRVSALVSATVIFLRHVAEFYGQMIEADRSLSRRWRDRARGYLTLGRFLFGRPGPLRRIVPEWLDYFRPGFHPWDHDNSHFLADLDALTADIEAAAEAA